MSDGRRANLTGAAAEEIAVRAYIEAGGEILARRWRRPEGEIDLIVRLAGAIVFVEVKARRDLSTAAHAISERQLRRLGAAAERYLAEAGGDAAEYRLDVVLVDGAGRSERIENAASFDTW